jgi:hypothetical protein
MEITKTELESIEVTVAQQVEQIFELGDMQLALVGGGCGDIHLA